MIKELVRIYDRLVTRFKGPTPGIYLQYPPSPFKKDSPRIRGFVTTRLKDEHGNVVHESKGENIWTLYGREYLANQIAWRAFGTERSNSTPAGEYGVLGVPNPAVLYIGVGDGVGQLELAATSQLNHAVPYTGQPSDYTYLKQISLPPVWPSSGSVKFTVEFLRSEINIVEGAPVDVTEFGLYLDTADPKSAYNPPVAYKVMEPQPKTLAHAIETEWEVRFE